MHLHAISIEFSFVGLGHEKVVDTLISAGADVNIAGAQSWTALHLAAQNGKCRIVLYPQQKNHFFCILSLRP